MVYMEIRNKINVVKTNKAVICALIAGGKEDN